MVTAVPVVSFRSGVPVFRVLVHASYSFAKNIPRPLKMSKTGSDIKLDRIFVFKKDVAQLSKKNQML